MALKLLDISQPADRRAFDQLVDRLRLQAGGSGEVVRTVADVIDAVKKRGDEAVSEFMRKWTDPAFSDNRIRVTDEQLQAAAKAMDPGVRDAITTAIEHVRAYQQHIKPADPPTVNIDGAELGLRFTPLRRVGLIIPGGKAAYPSSVIMTVVPAQVAGVKEICIASPPPTGADGDISPLVLGTANLLGITEVYRVGGAQAVAALAYGTETIRPVDFIAGPGNAYTQQAKRQVFGTIGIDGFYGPSELVVLADKSANPAHIAADLLAQAEHDPGCCFLISTDRAVIDSINTEIDRQLAGRDRKRVIDRAISEWSAAILAPDEATVFKLADELAAEHVTLAVKDPQAALNKLHNAGAWFLGDSTPVASGDYYAGPSHCLPTGTTARFTSGISVYTFLKRSSVERYPAGLSSKAIQHIAALADAEGLDAHANSVRIRRK